MKAVFHPENSRGHADHGWLLAKHSFSFASWQNRERMNFGALRVLNDDSMITENKKTEFDYILSTITVTNNKIQMLSEYMSAFNNVDTNNNNE